MQFQYFDADGNGTLDRQELLTALQSDDPVRWTPARIDALLQAADTNRDGVIQYEEFVAYLETNSQYAADLGQVVRRIPLEAINHLVRTLSGRSAESGRDDLCAPLASLEEAPWDQKEGAIVLLLKLLRNIDTNPSEAKYRRLKKTNKTLTQKVFSVPGCMELLIAAGFDDEGEELVLPEGTDIGWVVDEVQSFGNKELHDKLRVERDAKIAARKEEDHKAKKLTGLPAGNGGDEERQRILEKAEYDRQERVAREKLAAEGYREENHVPAEKGGAVVKRFEDIGVDVNRGGG